MARTHTVTVMPGQFDPISDHLCFSCSSKQVNVRAPRSRKFPRSCLCTCSASRILESIKSQTSAHSFSSGVAVGSDNLVA
jgi:hypothetical protein